MGRQQSARSAGRFLENRIVVESPAVEEAASTLPVPQAPTYTDMANRTRQPNHAWRSELASIPPPPAFTDTTPPPTRAEIVRLLRQREARRAFAGAPPTVPHPIDQHQSASCLACHGKPTRIGEIDVPQMSHAPHSQCIQCHAPASGPGSALRSPPPALATPSLANSFAGLAAASGGTRAYQGAPPVMPHTTAMRESCVSCHGPGGSSIIKTTHPTRQNCLQCHATDATRETLPLRPSL
jgi:cytochrome c-type protein NapB